MNKQRRKALEVIVQRVEAFQRELEELNPGELESIAEDLEALKEEEDDYYGNLPDSIREGAKGEAVQEAILELEAAVTALEELHEQLSSFNAESIVESICNAKEGA